MTIWPSQLSKLATVGTAAVPTLGKHNSYTTTRTDTGCGITSGSPVIIDAAVTSADAGKALVAPGVASGNFVGTVIAGTSFRVSSSSSSQVDVNATSTNGSASVTVSAALAPVLPPLTTGAVATALANGELVRVKVSKSKADSSANAVTLSANGSDRFENGLATQPLLAAGEKITLVAGTVPGGSGPVWIIEEHTVPRDTLDIRYPVLDAASLIPDAKIPLGIARTSALAATFRPAGTIQAAPKLAVVTDFQTGHGWVAGGTLGSSNVNDTTDSFAGTQCVTLTSNAAGGVGYVQRATLPAAVDLTSKIIEIPVKVVSGLANLLYVQVLIGDTTFTNYRTFQPVDGTLSPQLVNEGEWFVARLSLADVLATTGSPTISAVTSIRIVIRDANNGSATVLRVGRVGYYTPAVTVPTVVWWFDDTFLSHRTIAAPYMARYGMVGTAAPIISRLDGTDSGGYSWAQAHELAEQYGWEIAPHALSVANHDGFSTLGDGTGAAANYVTEYNAVKQALSNNGFGASDHYAYPGGYHTPTIESVVGRYFSTARTTVAPIAETVPPAHRTRTRSHAIGMATTLTAMQGWINALKPGNRCDMYIHDIVTTPTLSLQTSTAVFQSMVDWLAGQVTAGNVRVVTASTAWQLGLA